MRNSLHLISFWMHIPDDWWVRHTAIQASHMSLPLAAMFGIGGLLLMT
jgi:hypothetical protein